MQKAFEERRPLGEPTVAAQYQGPYAVPLPQFVPGVFNQQVAPSTLGHPSPLLQQTMAPGPVVMPAPQNVAPPRWMITATGPMPTAAATRNFALQWPAFTPRPSCYWCEQCRHLYQDCPTEGAEPRPAHSAAAEPDKLQMASGEDMHDVYICQFSCLGVRQLHCLTLGGTHPSSAHICCRWMLMYSR